ncbi:MFS transporter [Kitasatospora sp. NPDC096140]|uniref:MFS transporter n=1 Tax=unclassified Kitasatospora TaxID=2633591 RepID=UPI00331AEFA7
MKPLADPRFRRLLIGQALSGFGSSALFLTLGIWAKDLTGSNAAAGGVEAALGAPMVLSPLFGHLADRVRRRPLLMATNALMALAVLSLLAVHGGEQLWIIYLVAVCYGVAFGVLGAASAGIRRDLLPDDQLTGANALLQTVAQGLRIIAPLVGVAVYAAAGAGTLAVLNSLTFLAAILALAGLRVEESVGPESPREPFLRSALAGVRHIGATPVLARIGYAAACAFCVIGLSQTVMFAVVDEGLGRPPSALGPLNAVQGVGAVVGGLTVSALIRRVGMARTAGLGIGAFTVAALAYCAPNLAFVVAGEVADGIAITWIMVVLSSAAQLHTPSRLQGRVNAICTMLVLVPQSLSLAAGTVLIDRFDYRTLLIAMAAVTAACAAALVLRPVPAVTERTFVTSAPTGPADRADTADRDTAGSGPPAQR